MEATAEVDARLKGAVVALPLERGAAIEPEIAKVATLKTTRGVRRLIQNQADPDFVLRPHFLEALKLLPKYGLSFDICIFHRQLGKTLEMVRRCPEVSFVLDHIAKPGIKDCLVEPWRSEMTELAKLPNVVCKLSGVTTEADHAAWTPAQLRPLHRSRDRRFGPRPHPLRRRLAGFDAGRRLPAMADFAGGGDRAFLSRGAPKTVSRQCGADLPVVRGSRGYASSSRKR